MITSELSFSPFLRNVPNKVSALNKVSSFISSNIFAVFGARLSAGTSDFIVSLAEISNPHTIFITSDDITRVNFGNLPSSTSHASAGFQFKEMFAIYGSSISSFPAFHFANSTISDVNIKIALTQYIEALILGGDPLANLALVYYEQWSYLAPDLNNLIYYENWSNPPDIFTNLIYQEPWEPISPTLNTPIYHEFWEPVGTVLETPVYIEHWNREPNEFDNLIYHEVWEPVTVEFNNNIYYEPWNVIVPVITTAVYYEGWNPGTQFPPTLDNNIYHEEWSDA